MRVPSIGVTLEERREIREFVREGYALAERMLANYRDPPTMFEQVGQWFAGLRAWAFSR
jgi:hypothetical protein